MASNYAKSVREMIREKKFNYTPTNLSSSSEDDEDSLRSPDQTEVALLLSAHREGIKMLESSYIEAFNQRDLDSSNLLEQRPIVVEDDQSSHSGETRGNSQRIPERLVTVDGKAQYELSCQTLNNIKILDDEFVNTMLQIEGRYQKYLKRAEAISVEKWSKVLCQMIDSDPQDLRLEMEVRQNRNLHATLLLDMILSRCSLAAPFLLDPPHTLMLLPPLQFDQVVSKLSKRYKQTMNGYVPNKMVENSNLQSARPSQTGSIQSTARDDPTTFRGVPSQIKHQSFNSQKKNETFGVVNVPSVATGRSSVQESKAGSVTRAMNMPL